MLRLTLRGPSPVLYEFKAAPVRIGRDPENDVVIGDPLLSRFHARVRREPAGWVLVDLGSRNGTLVNGSRLAGEAPLRPGDEIQLGDTVLVVGDGAGHGARPHPPGVTLSRPVGPGRRPPELVGGSPAMARLRREIERIAASASTVLLGGETGTGKEEAARLIHARSPRAGGPLVTVNCPGLPPDLVESELFGIEREVATGVAARPGQLERADGGTLFLDEVGDLDLRTQSKLLRFLQDHQVERIGARGPRRIDVRVIAATNRDLAAAAERGEFRRDLYYRLSVIPLVMPPLRERREDVPALAAHFLTRKGESRPLTAEAVARLVAHHWPGNVRELENVIERAIPRAEGDAIGPDDLILCADPAPAARAPEGQVREAGGGDDLYARIVHGGESFWTAVREPFLRRRLAAGVVRALIARACREHGSYKDVARAFHIESEHKRLLDFLRRHGLGLSRRPRV